MKQRCPRCGGRGKVQKVSLASLHVTYFGFQVVAWVIGSICLLYIMLAAVLVLADVPLKDLLLASPKDPVATFLNALWFGVIAAIGLGIIFAAQYVFREPCWHCEGSGWVD